ncbi:MAG: YggS family pyridoxal phosphate-dependent enzyme [Elusimicrobia bacterium]|nr:MAG: YggS family pyridoxal phosphate-dependent enzyme [Elusimicrobiota bacterium]
MRDIRSRIDAAALRAGRNPSTVEPIAVVKYAALEDVQTLLEEGNVAWCAESRVQDALKRREALKNSAEKSRWRFIGHLQTKKVNQVLGKFDSIDSLDSLKLAEALEKRLEDVLSVLVQVKLTEKETQNGVPLSQVGDFIKALEAYPKLQPRGLMAIAPMEEDPEKLRPHFRAMREAAKQHFPNLDHPILSMGMSNDFEVAVEEGASLVRIGSVLFAR